MSQYSGREGLSRDCEFGELVRLSLVLIHHLVKRISADSRRFTKQALRNVPVRHLILTGRAKRGS